MDLDASLLSYFDVNDIRENRLPFVAYHPVYVHPLPPGHRHPMIKYELLPEQLLYEGVLAETDFFEPEVLDKELLFPVHTREFAERLLNQELTVKEIRRIGLPMNDKLVERELRIIEGTRVTAEIALKIGIAFNIAGGTHHAGSDWGEGFCLLNDQAVAADYLVKTYALEKVLILDLDVHQGNGTAEIFEQEPRIYTFSMHAANNFPFRKEKSDLDIGLQDGTLGPEYLRILEEQLEFLFGEVKPKFVFYQAGADVLETDKLGKLSLTKEDIRQRDALVFHYCKTHNVPVQVGTGGGYAQRVADIVDVHSTTFKEGISSILM